MKKINITVLLLLFMSGVDNLAATPYSPGDTFRVRAFASNAAGSADHDLSIRKPTAVFAQSAKGSLAELKRGIADSTGGDVGEMYYVNASDGKKTALNDETVYRTQILPKLINKEGSIEFKPR